MVRRLVSVLFSEPKIPQLIDVVTDVPTREVSVLFSEPKIPQFLKRMIDAYTFGCFSALQRAENSSIAVLPLMHNSRPWCFSALQRAENSSMLGYVYTTKQQRVSVLFSEPKIPQSTLTNPSPIERKRFSALQRAENSSILQVYKDHELE